MPQPHHDGRAMANKSADYQRLSDAPDLSETAQTIARGREIVEQSRRIVEKADRRIEEVQASLEQADRVLDLAESWGAEAAEAVAALLHRSSLHAEEGPAIPARAGDGFGDG